MSRTATRVGRRRFIRGVGLASVGATVAGAPIVEAAQSVPRSTGMVVHMGEGQLIPAGGGLPIGGGRMITIKVDSELTPGVRMSMIIEDIPPTSQIRVHLHQHEDEIVFIRMGTGIATLGDREIPVGPGAILYVPQGVWHGLRNNGTEVLGMGAVYSPPGFEQAFKGSLKPNRTEAEIAAHRKKHGIVYRDP